MPNPLQTAITALLADLAAAAVTFGVLSNTTAAAVVTAATTLVSIAFIIANELRHKTNLNAPK